MLEVPQWLSASNWKKRKNICNCLQDPTWVTKPTVSLWPHVLWLPIAHSVPATLASSHYLEPARLDPILGLLDKFFSIWNPLPVFQICRFLYLLPVFIQMSFFSSESFPKSSLKLDLASPASTPGFPYPAVLSCLLYITCHLLNHHMICLISGLLFTVCLLLLEYGIQWPLCYCYRHSL